jgi:polyhydroxyalkanoate synthesis regulator phasin
MITLFEKTAMMGMGALSLSQKKAEELLGELKERLGCSEEEGRSLLEKLKAQAEEQKNLLTKAAEEEVQKACDRLGLVRREELERLSARLDVLEKRGESQDPAC